MGSETGPPLPGVLVHPCAIFGKHGAVYDHGRGPEGIDRLAFEGCNECALLGEGGEVVGGLCLWWYALHGCKVCNQAVGTVVCAALVRQALDR